MANGGGNKGFPNPQSSRRIINKRGGKRKKQKVIRINSDSHFMPMAAPNHAFPPAYPNVPALPPAPALAAPPALSCDWVAAREVIPGNDQISGYIFMCNGKTKGDCYKYKVFGLPAARMEVVERIKPHMKLFLFDCDLKLLHGIYVAASNGRSSIEPTAFEGKFSSQVRFEIFKDCLPLPQSSFKHVIKTNYMGGSKFRQELTDEQVANLVSLFRPIVVPHPVTTDVSPMPNAVPPVTVVPSNIRVKTPPAAELSASYDQYLAGLQRTHAGFSCDRLHVQQAGPQFPHMLHASMPNSAGLQPVVESMHILPEVPKRQYYHGEAHQAFLLENPALHNRFTSVPNDCGRGIVPQSGITNNYYNHNSTVAATNVPLHTQFSTPGHGQQTYLPHSSLTSSASYRAQVAADDPRRLYSFPHQPMPVPFAVAAQAHHAGVAQNRESQTGFFTDYPNFSAAYWTTVASGDSKHAYFGPNQMLSSGGTQNHSSAYVPPQAHVKMVAAHHGSTHLPSSSEAAAYWTVAGSGDPNQVPYYAPA